MNTYRRRYISESQFARRCRNLKIPLRAFNQELEIYEQHKTLFPVARIIKPKEYIQSSLLLDEPQQNFVQTDSQWNELRNLTYPQNRVNFPDDRALWHPIDIESELDNNFLYHPTLDVFKPWDEYKVMIETEPGKTVSQKNVVHYYHYWQVHQVYKIQKRFPLFAKYLPILKKAFPTSNLTESHYVPIAHGPEATLDGYYNYFDALSFFITLYENERKHTFDSTLEQDGGKKLNSSQFAEYNLRVEKHAKFVFNRFNLEIEVLYKFLIYLLELHSDYRRDEKSMLAIDLEKDLIQLTRFIAALTRNDFNAIEREIGQRSPFWIKEKFRYLDKVVEIEDHVTDTFRRQYPKYNRKVVSNHLSESECNSLLLFLKQNKNLFTISYAISDINSILNDQRKFRNINLYVGLSNLTTGFECYLRELADRANNPKIETKTLYPLIKTMFRQV